MTLSITAAIVLLSVTHVQAQNTPGVTVRQEGNVTNYQTVGDFAATQQLSCLSLQEIKNTYTPPDLLTGISQCIAKGEYDKAARLFSIGGAYVRFDRERIDDPTLEDSPRIFTMKMSAQWNDKQRSRFTQALGALNESKKTSHDFCLALDRIGPPQYYPQYLVMHGMNAFLGKTSPAKALKSNFDAKATWTEIRTSYLSCPA